MATDEQRREVAAHLIRMAEAGEHIATHGDPSGMPVTDEGRAALRRTAAGRRAVAAELLAMCEPQREAA